MPTPARPAGPRPWLRGAGYRRLLGVRFAAQFGDGMFQGALGAAVLFNPERQADPLAVAAGLAVLLLPYSLIGPFAGALLDRWDRRRVLLWADVARAGLVLGVAAVVTAGVAGPPLFVLALVVTGVSRFVQAGLSAALPRVVDRDDLVAANSLAVTAGAGCAALGGVLALGLNVLVGAGNAGSGATTALAAAGPLLAGLLAAGFRPGALGPDRLQEGHLAATTRQEGGLPATIGGPAGDSGPTGRLVARGLFDGARAVADTPPVAATFLALAAHRLAFGVSTLVTLLLFRHAVAGDAGLPAGIAGVGAAVALAAAGLGGAALVTPLLVRRFGRAWAVRGALVLAGMTQLGLALTLSVPALLVAAFVIGLAGQVVKLCTDAAVQGEAGDGVLGRVFALYDIVFNVGYVLAITATALLSPPDGRAPALLAGAAALYALGLLAHDATLRRRVAGRPPSRNEVA